MYYTAMDQEGSFPHGFTRAELLAAVEQSLAEKLRAMETALLAAERELPAGHLRDAAAEGRELLRTVDVLERYAGREYIGRLVTLLSNELALTAAARQRLTTAHFLLSRIRAERDRATNADTPPPAPKQLRRRRKASPEEYLSRGYRLYIAFERNGSCFVRQCRSRIVDERSRHTAALDILDGTAVESRAVIIDGTAYACDIPVRRFYARTGYLERRVAPFGFRSSRALGRLRLFGRNYIMVR